MPVTSPNLPEGPDAAARIGPLHRAHEQFLHTGDAPDGVRRLVASSWVRCRKAGVDPDRAVAPVQLTGNELRAYRAGHPLAAVLVLLRDLLGRTAKEDRYLMAVTDADARLLWVEGHPVLRRRAQHMNFVEGAAWTEEHVGTNAPGTAIALRQPVQIFTAEHFSHVVQPWTCSAAPICDPRTGELLGVVDITGGDHLGTPLSLALVRAGALAAEGELLRRLGRRRPDGRSPASVHAVDGARLEVLGRDEGVLVVGSHEHRLSRRHSEILTLLVQHPNGVSGAELGMELYEEAANPTTLRAEMLRLRRRLPDGMLASRPYRLRIPVAADFVELGRLLRTGAVAEAVRRYRGPLLPRSEAPGVEETRHRTDRQVRSALVASADPLLLEKWLSTSWGRDELELWELLARTARAAATRSIAAAEARRLAAEQHRFSHSPRPKGAGIARPNGAT